MMTIVTHVHLKEGAGGDWDGAMRTRLSVARKATGWIGGQLLRPADKPDRRVIVGTWRTRADWEVWHHDPQFTQARQRLDGLESAPSEHWWHDVVVDARKGSKPPARTSKSPSSKQRTKGRPKRQRRQSA